MMQLRNVTDDDHEWLVELHNDPDVLKNLTNPEPINLSQHMTWWKNSISCRNSKQLRLIFTINDVPVGFTKFYDIDTINKNCMLGADIHKVYRGQGHAKHMWNLMLIFSFNTLMLNRVSLSTAEFNIIGQRVYKNIGFKEEGRLIKSLYRDGRYYDQISMYMLAGDWFSNYRNINE